MQSLGSEELRCRALRAIDVARVTHTPLFFLLVQIGFVAIMGTGIIGGLLIRLLPRFGIDPDDGGKVIVQGQIIVSLVIIGGLMSWLALFARHAPRLVLFANGFQFGKRTFCANEIAIVAIGSGDPRLASTAQQDVKPQGREVSMLDAFPGGEHGAHQVMKEVRDLSRQAHDKASVTLVLADDSKVLLKSILALYELPGIEQFFMALAEKCSVPAAKDGFRAAARRSRTMHELRA